MVAFDVEGHEANGLRYSLISTPGRDSPAIASRLAIASRIVGGLTGQKFLVPAGEYELVFTDSTLNGLVGSLAVVVNRNEVSDVRAQIPEHVHSVLVRLVEVGGTHGFPGVAIRLRQDDLPTRMTGGDGVTEFGPFWVRRGDFVVDGWAPGYSLARREVRIGLGDADGQVVELQMSRVK